MNAQTLALIALTLAAIPAVLFSWNLFLVRRPRRSRSPSPIGRQVSVSVLIPARNEAVNIEAALESVLANREADLEVLVLDDHSTDGTAGLVASFARRDSRVKLVTAGALPPGWCGKQHACCELARRARQPWLVFMDADVRLAPDALTRMVGFMCRSGAALASGVPRQITVTFFERLMIPLVHFVLLGFLPVWRMRRCTRPAYAAGCGQLFMVAADAYRCTGGHSSIRSTLHDGIKLPRLFRQHGFPTDLFDATDVASCRMYAGAGEVVAGLMKNAHEALASRVLILPMTLILAGGQVLPWLLLVAWPLLPPEAKGLSAVGAGLTLGPRLLAAWRFRQPLLGALLHPLAILIFISIQWVSFVRCALGRNTEWKGRQYASQPVEPSRRKPPNPHVVHGGAAG